MSVPMPEVPQQPQYNYDAALRRRWSVIAGTDPAQANSDATGALSRRLQSISGIGEQQNQYVNQQVAQRAQRVRMPTATGQVEGVVSNTGFAPSRNPRNAQEAIAWAKQAAANGDSQWYRRCLAFVAQAYGQASSGTNYAIDAFNRLPANMKSTDRNAPAGALMYWNTGKRAGHVALYLGNGMIASNDISGNGRIGIVPMSAIEQKWGAKYVGWSQPQFATTR